MKAAALSPQDGALQANLGAIHLRGGNIPAGIKHLEAARALDPKNYGALTLLGKAYAQTGKNREAANAYGAAADLQDEGAPSARKSLIRPRATTRALSWHGQAACRRRSPLTIKRWHSILVILTLFSTPEPSFFSRTNSRGRLLGSRPQHRSRIVLPPPGRIWRLRTPKRVTRRRLQKPGKRSSAWTRKIMLPTRIWRTSC
jgi:tetratricopeptide (TPR) repeat protein